MLEKKLGRIGSIVSTLLLILVILVIFVYGIGFLYKEISSAYFWITKPKETVQLQQSVEPCFTILQNEAAINEEGLVRLIIKTANTANSTKEDISTRVLIWGNNFNEDMELLYRKTMKHANSQNSGAISDNDIGFRLNPERKPYLSLFAVFEAECVDGKSQDLGSQIEFLKIVPEPETGKGLVVVNANIHEKARIEEYIREHGIPKLKR